MVQAQPESGNDALNKFIQLYICTNHALHATDSEQRAYSTLVSRFSDKLASGQSIPADLQLAAKVAGGVLRKDSLIMGLMQSFVHMSEAAARGCVRTRTSKFMDREAVENAICTLGSSREAKHLLERFGCNSVALASHTWHHPALPEFFCSLRDADVLCQNFRKVLSLLQVPGMRRHHVVVDETCVAANFDMLSGFHPGGGVGKGIVGGGFSADPNSDWSYLLPQHHSLSALPEKHKSKLVMSVVLTRNDTNKMTFDVCCSSQELECFFFTRHVFGQKASKKQHHYQCLFSPPHRQCEVSFQLFQPAILKPSQPDSCCTQWASS